nr:hypothetical protein [Saprospiraceae bacterium]
MKYVEIYETLSAQELNLIKLGLSKRGIDFQTLYETALQVGNVAALGGRGAVIQVPEDDLEKAREALLELGFISDSHTSNNHNTLLDAFDDFTKKIPLYGKLNLTVKLFLIAILILGLLYFQFLYYTQ